MEFLHCPTRNLFFTGKGGVGKTSVACASAVRLADRGKRVLLISTDPASNLDEVLSTSLNGQPTPIAGVDNLFAMNLDPEAAAAGYRERMVGPYRGLLPAAAIRSMEEQFSGSCTLEIAAFDELVNELAGAGQGVVMTMGKGGVGKTTLAAAIAFALAERGIRVHLSTTDPAAHVETAADGENLPQLTVGRIDPQVEKQRYAEEVLGTAGAGLDSQGRALLEEDLRSPCTEEIAVFRAFAVAVSEGHGQVVVLDTAPTGHTILLLDAALRYHREVTRQSSGMPESVQQLLPRLRDPDFTRILIVTQAEATPVHEAARLQRDLERAAIRPFAWVVNQSLVPQRVTDPTLIGRQRQELRYVREVDELSNHRFCLVPWHPHTPKGRGPLLALVNHNQDPRPNPR